MTLTQPDILTGAYVTADQLLSLRFRPTRALQFAASPITGIQAGLRLSNKKVGASILPRFANISPGMIFAASIGA